MTQPVATPRPIRSYVLRQGRMTPGQQKALQANWSEYGVNPHVEVPYDGARMFGRNAPRVMEIGFGMGDTLVAMASAYPEWDFIGIEVHTPGVGRCLANAKALNLTNLRVFAFDAIDVLKRCIEPQSLDRIYLLFPDPWPKKKHHKRRLVQADFVSLVASRLKPSGEFHLATDWEEYADHMLSTLEQSPSFINAFGRGAFAPSGENRLCTKFERRGQALGHGIWDLVYRTL